MPMRATCTLKAKIHPKATTQNEREKKKIFKKRTKNKNKTETKIFYLELQNPQLPHICLIQTIFCWLSIVCNWNFIFLGEIIQKSIPPNSC